ncbi:hypothetical protein [Streptomyces sp. NPDC001340]
MARAEVERLLPELTGLGTTRSIPAKRTQTLTSAPCWKLDQW